MKVKRWVCCALTALILFRPAAVQSGEKTLIIGRSSDAVSLDSNIETTASGAVVYSNIIEPLIRINAQGEIEPHLAEHFEVTAANRIRFFIRRNVKFHDGTPLDARAVQFTFNRALAMPARWKTLFGPLEAVEIVDDYTVDIVTSVPFGPLAASTAMVYTGIVSPNAVEKYGDDYGRNPVGTGPFKFSEWKAKDSITLVRNDEYWGEKARLERVVFRVMPESGSRMTALRSGDIDIAMHPTPAELPLFRGSRDFTVAETEGLRVFFLGFNNARFPTDDPRVRRALSHAVDVDAVIENILEGSASRPAGYLAPSVFGARDMALSRRFPYDPAKAAALLAQAGWKDSDADGILDKNGRKLTLRFLGTRGRYLMDDQVCQAVGAMLEAAGVDVKLDFFEWAATITEMRRADLKYNMYALGWLTTNADADYTLYSKFHSSRFPPNGWNNSRFINARVDELLDRARSSQNRTERTAAYAEAQEIIADSASWIPIYNSREVFVMHSKVKDFEPHPNEYLMPLRTVWKE